MNKGFYYSGKRYLYVNNKLYRLPFELNLKHYRQIKCATWKCGFILGDRKKSKKQIEKMVVMVDWELEVKLPPLNWYE